MALIQITTFRLTAGADEAAFLAADERARTGFYYHQPGMARATTARSDDGEFAVVVLWASPADFDAAADPMKADAGVQEASAMVDQSTVRTRTYATFD